jgi:ubiquinone/menaquinone biosynthesis C-methylase UbiE
MPSERDFTPAFPFLWAYDLIVAADNRERTWRSALLRQLDPQPSDIIADIGCGTGSFLALLGRTGKWAELIGVDPDDRILRRARRKLEAGGIVVTLKPGYLRDVRALLAGAGVNKIASSLVFHQVPLAEKRAGLSAIYSALSSGGELHVADFGLQRTRLTRSLFRIVQHVDGYENTQPNADGVLPSLMKEAGFAQVKETSVNSDADWIDFLVQSNSAGDMKVHAGILSIQFGNSSGSRYSPCLDRRDAWHQLQEASGMRSARRGRWCIPLVKMFEK